MTTKLLKTIKLVLAITSVIIFFTLISLDYDYIGVHNSYFSLGLIAVLILAIANYFRRDEKFNVAVNVSALFMAASFGYKLFEEAVSYYDFSITYLLLPIILAPIFMIDSFKLKEIKKSVLSISKLYFQLSLILFIFFLYLAVLGNSLAAVSFVVLLLCACYIIANERKHKSAGWLKVILYAVLFYYLYGFFNTLSTSIRFTKLFQPGITNLQLIKAVYFDFFWSLLLSGILTFVLVFNSPAQQESSWLKKLIGKFRGK